MQIAEVAQKCGITNDTLRYYERIGLIPTVTRSRGGIRDYSDEDERWVEFMTCMRSAGLSIDALVEYATLFRQGETTKDARKALLIDQREALVQRIADLQATLDRLNLKIERYDQGLALKEKEMS
jgi:DNA-binding transcriptional MerR regulator